MIEAEITKPAKHGFVLDLVEGARRIQVRIFEFEEQALPPPADGRCEMPVTITETEAITRLRQAMEVLRESVISSKFQGASFKTEAAAEVPVVAEYDQPAQARRHEDAWQRLEAKLNEGGAA